MVKAIELFKKNRFDNVTINEICESSNITKMTFYYNYDSKKALLLDYFSLFDENTENNLIKIDMKKQNQMFCYSLNDFHPNVKRLRQIVIDYTRKAQEAGEIDTDISAEDLSYCFASAFLGLAINWSSTGGNYDL